MGKKKREPIQWDELLKNPSKEFKSEDFERPGTCMLPPNHHEMMKGERPRADKVPEQVKEMPREPKKDIT